MAAPLLVCLRASGSSATLWSTLVASVSMATLGVRVKVPLLCHQLHKVGLSEGGSVAAPALSML